jgi:hypothetical protein
MSNRFFNDSFNAPFGSLAKSAPLDAQFQLIQAGFDAVATELDALTRLTGITTLQGFPASFSGQAGKQLLVNTAETAVVFAARGTLNYKTSAATAYTLVLADSGSFISFSAATAVTATIPPNSSVAFDIGTALIVAQYGAGKVTLAPGSGVTLRAADGLLSTRVQFSQVTAIKVGTDEWVIGGDRAA